MLAYLDCSSGISGDKFLACCIDAGAPVARIQEVLDALGTGARLEVSRVSRGGLIATHVRVDAPESPPHRTWRDIRTLIERSSIEAAITASALAVFERLATAEAEVHGTTPEEVHFHEVGAIDSIADVVGSCAALSLLGVQTLVCSPVVTGSGTVSTSHGTLPIPAPATAALLQGIPVRGGDETSEMTTPTGAALVSTLAEWFGPLPPMTLVATGAGAGTRKTASVPNIARLLLGEAADPSADTEIVTSLATNIDHISAEHAAFAAEELIAAGARDAWVVPIVMKKGRAGLELHVLVTPDSEAPIASLLIELTGTLGVRVEPTYRYTATRREVVLPTRYGEARFKISGSTGAATIRAEHDDVARIAREFATPYDTVSRQLADDARDGRP